MQPRFVHLRLHSEFSIVDGLARIDDAIAAAAADGQGALALGDSANLFGAVRFYKAARAKGLKPIVGCDAWISNPAEPERPHRLLLLVQDHAGYLNLCRVLSRAWIENAGRGRAEVRLDWFGPACPTPRAAARRRWRGSSRAASTSSCSGPVVPRTNPTAARR